MTGLIADLDRRRIEAERRRAPMPDRPPASTLSRARRGRARLAAGRRGASIASAGSAGPTGSCSAGTASASRRPPGTPVRAVRGGTRGPGRALRGVRPHRRAQPRQRLLHALPLPRGHRGRGGPGRGRRARWWARSAGATRPRAPTWSSRSAPRWTAGHPRPRTPSSGSRPGGRQMIGSTHSSATRTLAARPGRGPAPRGPACRRCSSTGLRGVGQAAAGPLARSAPAVRGAAAPRAPAARCRPCRLALGLEHPDLHWYFPLPRPKGVSGDRLADALESARADALAEIREQPLRPSLGDEMRGLYLGLVQSLRRRAQSRPTMAPVQVFIIADAELLVPQESSPEAANALLKLLEEPPADPRFILTSSEPGRLLPTIRSRSVPLHLAPLPRERVAAFLAEQRGRGPQDRRLGRCSRAGLHRPRPRAFFRRRGAGPLEALRRDGLRARGGRTGRRARAWLRRGARAVPCRGARARRSLRLRGGVAARRRRRGGGSRGARAPARTPSPTSRARATRPAVSPADAATRPSRRWRKPGSWRGET